jgi:NADPH2:quinone reductase
MADEGAIKPVVYDRPYRGLKDIARVFENMEARKVWGRAVVSLLDSESAGDASKSRI